MPLARGHRLILSAAARDEHAIARQIFRLGAQPVKHPRPHARPAGNGRARIHQRVRGIVIDRVRRHRPNDRDVICHTADVREELANVLAGFAELLKIMLRPEACEVVALALQLRNRLPLRDALGHRLAVHLPQLRLVIQRLQMTRPTRHAKMNHPLNLRLVMQLREHPRPLVNLRPVSRLKQ